MPRFVTHADDAFTTRLTRLYESEITSGDRVFDVMSSWISFLPDIQLECITGHGLNEAELEENLFDVICCALSVQYPGEVFSEFGRILTSDGIAIVSFSNRMFPTKAIQAWRARSMDERAALVEEYVAAGGFEATDRIVDQPGTDPFYVVIGRRPPE